MALLTKYVYGLQTDPKKTPFGLLNNQVRIENTIQSAGWFNKNGFRLGCGDLDMKDMANIAKHIAADEVFIALNEANSEWDLPSHLDRAAPGFDYVMSKALWVMARSNIGGVILRMRDDIEEKEEAEKDGVKYIRIPRQELIKLMTTPPPLPKKSVEKKRADLLSDDDALKAAIVKARKILGTQTGQTSTATLPPTQTTTKSTYAKKLPAVGAKPIKGSSGSNTAKPITKTIKGALTP
jgi:hypothetical protein